MPVAEVMSRDVASCSPLDPMSRGAQVLWERDCGIVPVLDAGKRVVGLITDRDVSMACWTKGLPPQAMPVEQAMARDVRFCLDTDSVERALEIMADAQVRRLPVVDRAHRLVGMLSLSDVVQAMHRVEPAVRERWSKDLFGTLSAVTRPRAAPSPPRPAAAQPGR
jgi:CBS domain-containing protein